MKALKIIGIILVVFVVAVVGLGYWGISRFDNLIKTGVEQVASEMTGAPVTIENIETSFREVRGEVTGFVIGNPAGFNTDHAFSLGKVAVQLNPNGIGDNLFTIKEILIDGAKIIYEEQNLTGSNLKTISDNIQNKISSTGGNNEITEDQNSSSPEIRFIVESFTFSNAEVQLVSAEYGEKTLSIPSISATDIGGSNGITGEELGAYLMDKVYNETKGIAEDEIKSRVKDKVRGKAKEAIEERLSDENKDTLDKVRGLLGR